MLLHFHGEILIAGELSKPKSSEIHFLQFLVVV